LHFPLPGPLQNQIIFARPLPLQLFDRPQLVIFPTHLSNALLRAGYRKRETIALFCGIFSSTQI
jgi:hypothetical protein